MIIQFPIKSIFIVTSLMFVLTLPGIADARGGGRGGGGFSRGGAASSGSFSRGGGGGGFSRGGGGGGFQKQGQRQDSASSRQESATQNQTQRQDSASSRQQTSTQNQSQRQDAVSGNQENRQNQQDKNREDWQDYGEDVHWDNHWHGDVNEGQAFVAGAVVGATAAAAARPVTTTTVYITTLPCSYTTAFVNGVTYYQCGSTWYSRGYVNGTVNYVVVQKPY